MFRIDSEHVVDATRTGGLARYSEIPLVTRLFWGMWVGMSVVMLGLSYFILNMISMVFLSYY